MRATSLALSLIARSPTTAFFGFVWTSRTGAKSSVIPTASLLIDAHPRRQIRHDPRRLVAQLRDLLDLGNVPRENHHAAQPELARKRLQLDGNLLAVESHQQQLANLTTEGARRHDLLRPLSCPGTASRQRSLEHRELSGVLRALGRSLADDDAIERQHSDAQAIQIVFARAREFTLERFEPRRSEHQIDAVEPLASDSRRLQPKPGRVQPACPARGLAQLALVDPFKPKVDVLCGSRRAFDERGPHPDNQVPDAQRVERVEQGSLSGGENDFEHGSDRDGAAQRARDRDT